MSAKRTFSNRPSKSDVSRSGRDGGARSEDRRSANSGAVRPTDDEAPRRPVGPGGRGLVIRQRAETTGVGKAPLERIRTFGDPVLKQQTKPVTVFDSHLEKLVRVMMDVMDKDEGVGLAANQIGVLSRVMVWRHPENEDERYAFINPKILERSEACCTASEGCLSVPGATVEVTRAEEVVVEAQDLQGGPLQVRLSGLPARIAQHEIDHLDGILIVDRTSSPERARVLKELRERALSV